MKDYLNLINGVSLSESNYDEYKVLTKSYKHVKTILGHMSIQDDMMQPIPIFCICSVEPLDMIITGGSNG
jgi:hypothetical protein